MRPMIQIQITLAGELAGVVGDTRMEYGMAPGARCGDLLALMLAKRPALVEIAERFTCSLNGRRVPLETVLADGDHLEISAGED